MIPFSTLPCSLTVLEVSYLFERTPKNIETLIKPLIKESGHLKMKRPVFDPAFPLPDNTLLTLPYLLFFEFLARQNPEPLKRLREACLHAILQWWESFDEQKHVTLPCLLVANHPIPLRELYHAVIKRMKGLDALKNLVEGHPDHPKLPGTTIEVYRISALLAANSYEEVLYEYPSLDFALLDQVNLYCKTYPYKGKKNYPSQGFKKMLNGFI